MHYELQNKEAAKDPRSHFARPSSSSPALNTISPNLRDDKSFSPSVVGPMGFSSLGLSYVERALEGNIEDTPDSRASRMPIKVCY